MTYGHFIWTDLSTFDMAAARKDYAALFGWQFSNDANYDFASAGSEQVSAVFPMPAPLVKINMPSFWMSYVHVQDLDKTVQAARAHDGVIIEVEPQAFNADSRIALVRDPSGAGFTLYEGPDITPRWQGPGAVIMRYHHLPDIGLIRDFYADLFGWTFEPGGKDPWPIYDIRHPDGSLVAKAEEVPFEISGKFRYWMPCFAVHSNTDTRARLEHLGGSVATKLTMDRLLVHDQQGAHFMIAPGAASSHPAPGSVPQAEPSGFAWKAPIGLVCIWLAVFLDIQAFWGVLFLIWTLPALKSRRADFIEPIHRDTQPLLYWALVGTWIILSLWLILGSFVDLA